MSSLEQLRQKLILATQIHSHTISWGQPHLMTQALREVKKTFDNPLPQFEQRSVSKILCKYRRSGGLKSFVDLKYVCYGVGMKLYGGWCLFSDDHLFRLLLDQVDSFRKTPRKFRKCYQGLLCSYFSYNIFTEAPLDNWEYLQQYLNDNLAILRQISPVSSWSALLEEHHNLFSLDPCQRYVKEVRAGDMSTINKILQDGLGISRDSWIWQELIFSQVTDSCKQDDRFFKADLERLLNIIKVNNRLAPNLITRTIAMLVSRYARCVANPTHELLMNMVINYIGNPWLKRTAWDAYVKKPDGQPDEKAWQMVNSWLKRDLIKDFFELLSDDGSADQRRLQYWLRFADTIQDMWFALGRYAYTTYKSNFREFRNKAKGRLLVLENAGVAQNNAFIMCFEKITVVEFGAKGNAVYMYKKDNLPFELTKGRVNGDRTGLKNQYSGQRLFHRDTTRANWESNFDGQICPLIGVRPPRKQTKYRTPTTVHPSQKKTILPGIVKKEYTASNNVSWINSAIALVTGNPNLTIQDNRPKGGAFWVKIINGRQGQYQGELIKLGFRYTSGKGWWRE